MANNEMFRVMLFGGFNKNDVNEHIRNLENEIETVKELSQKEKNTLINQIESCEHKRREREIEIEKLKETIAKKEEELQEVRTELVERARESQKQQEEQEQDMGICIDQEQVLLLKENQRLREQIEALEAEKEKELFDYETISKVLQDANRTAELIKEEAEEKGRLILEEAEAEVRKQKEIIRKRINAELEEKGIQLMAAKYKISHYVKEMDNAQQGLHSIYMRMNRMIEEMPSRLDDYWESDQYKMIESKEEEGQQ